MENLVKSVQQIETKLDSIFKTQLKELENSKFLKLNDKEMRSSLPKKGGIYVFYEQDEKPIYVGRTKNIHQRIGLHTRDSSKHESATFTFNLAKKEFLMTNSHMVEKKITRVDLMKIDDFIDIFNLQKKRVQNMFLKYIEIEHDIFQTMLEPYIAFKLETYPHHQRFETH